MAIEKILVEQFLLLSKQYPIFDVRSPGEYAHAHIPGAYSLPLFTDEERKVVGTAYKQLSKEVAIKIGLDYFGVKMRTMVENAEQIVKGILPIPSDKKQVIAGVNSAPDDAPCILLHCWRGGMRSAAVAWLLSLYGFKVYLLDSGYKAYREWIRASFEQPYQFTIIGGFTGSGKTLVLQELEHSGHATIDLEKLAKHKGSAFGALGQGSQPTQEMFENFLANELRELVVQNGISNTPIFIEDESQRIGLINIPPPFWQQMRKSPILFLEVSFDDRVDLITEEYGKFDKDLMAVAITRLQKRLGNNEAKMAIDFLLQNNYKECFSILLKYYDKYYQKGLEKREDLPALLQKIACSNKNIKRMAQKIIDEKITA